MAVRYRYGGLADSGYPLGHPLARLAISRIFLECGS
jgi:hypothetical protein